MTNVKVHIANIAYIFVVLSCALRIIPIEDLFIENILGKCLLLLRLMLIACEAIMLMRGKVSTKQFTSLCLLMVLTFFEYSTTGEWLLFDSFFILICFKQIIDYKKIYAIVFYTMLFSTASVIVLSILGFTTTKIPYYRADGTFRYTFGFSHPNALGGALLFIIIFYLLKEEHKNFSYLTIAIIFCCSLFTYVFPNSLSASICMFLIAVTLLIVKMKLLPLTRKILKERKISLILAVGAIAAIIFFVYLIATKRVGENYLTKLSGTFYTRFIYGQHALQEYRLSLFGQKIEMYNEAKIAASQGSLSYFNLDCTYFYMPIVKGVVPSLYFLFWIFKSIKRAIYSKYHLLFFFFALMMIYAVSETTVVYYLTYLFIGAMGYATKAENKIQIKTSVVQRTCRTRGLYKLP